MIEEVERNFQIDVVGKKISKGECKRSGKVIAGKQSDIGG
jgi:hypothetical protein